MVDIKSFILKTTAPALGLTLLISTIAGGVFKISRDGHPPVNPPDRPYVHIYTGPHYEIYNPVGRNVCRLGQEGRTYLQNAIKRINVNGYNRFQRCNDLRELCEQFNIMRGIYTGPGDVQNGWERNAYEYFFTRTGRYDELSQESQTLMAQCIKIMYDNKDDVNWNKIIRNALNAMSLHGNHCAWRATEIINESYRELVNFLRANHIGFDRNVDNGQFLVERVYTELKDDMVEDAKKHLSDYLISDRNRHESSRREPLNMLNEFEKELKYFLGMGEDRGHYNNGWCPSDPNLKAREYLNMLTCKKYLIKRLDGIIKSSLTDVERDRLFIGHGDEQISFERYCDLSGKSDEEIALLRESIARYQDGQFKDTLNNWIQGHIALSFDGGAVRVGGVISPIRKNVRQDRLEAIEGEYGRYNYTDNDGNRHVCTIIRSIGGNAQVEYVNEVRHDDVQCNITSMLEILSSRARIQNNLIKNDGNLIGCPELETVNAFKFMIICFNYGYLQD